MKLLVLADIHGYVENVGVIHSTIQSCDGIIIAGDITNFGAEDQALKVLFAFQYYQKPIFAVSGNCDLSGVDEVLRKNKISLHGTGLMYDGLRFVGVGGSLPCPGRTPNEAGENGFRAVLDKALDNLSGKEPLIFVSHQPAWGTQLDVAVSGRHTGSLAVREFIEQCQPILAISGHMHEAYGTDKIGETVLVNPGSFRQGRYAIVKIENSKVKTQLYP